jgi:hypothetical protein
MENAGGGRPPKSRSAERMKGARPTMADHLFPQAHFRRLLRDLVRARGRGAGRASARIGEVCEDQPFWGVLKQGTYFIAKENEPREAVCFFSCGAREVAAHVVRLDKEPDWAFLGLAMSVDGRSLLTVQIDREANDLMMIENFR